MKKDKSKKSRFALARLAEKALREAVLDAIRDHERTGDPLVVWRNGKVVKIHPRELRIKGKGAPYGAKRKGNKNE
jgi:hypothetical protein